MLKSFVQETILTLSPVSFDRLKTALLGEYIPLHVIAPENVTKDVMAEKVYDYFEKLQYKNNKKFEDHIKSFMATLDSLVEPHVAKVPQAKKNEPAPVVPRARKYYEKATGIRKSLETVSELIDYTRVMMCLYAMAIKSTDERISNFDFSIFCLDPVAIEASLKAEKESVLFGMKNPKPRFDTTEPYTADTCFFVIAIVLLYTIIGDSLEEDQSHE